MIFYLFKRNLSRLRFFFYRPVRKKEPPLLLLDLPHYNTAVAEEVKRTAAAAAESEEAFREQARIAAQKLGADSVEKFPPLFHQPPDKPENLSEKFDGLGQWMATCQAAIFEILFYLGEPALPLLRSIAFGRYDWTQANAIEILVRFAAQGIEREQTMNDLQREMPAMEFEALLYTASPLLRLRQKDPAIAALVSELEKIESFKGAVEELQGNQ